MDLFISHSILDAQSNSNFGVSSRSRWCVRVQIWWLLGSRQTVILEHWTGALPSLSATYHDCFYIHAELLHHRSWGLLASQVQRLHSAWRQLYGWTVRSRRRLEGPLVHHAVQVIGQIHLGPSPHLLRLSPLAGTILYLAWDSVLIVGTGFGRHALQS